VKFYDATDANGKLELAEKKLEDENQKLKEQNKKYFEYILYGLLFFLTWFYCFLLLDYINLTNNVEF